MIREFLADLAATICLCILAWAIFALAFTLN